LRHDRGPGTTAAGLAADDARPRRRAVGAGLDHRPARRRGRTGSRRCWRSAPALLTLLGDELGSLPLGLRALVISGVLVAVMVNLVMPVLSGAAARWESGAAADVPAQTAAEEQDRG